LFNDLLTGSVGGELAAGEFSVEKEGIFWA